MKWRWRNLLCIISIECWIRIGLLPAALGVLCIISGLVAGSRVMVGIGLILAAPLFFGACVLPLLFMPIIVINNWWNSWHGRDVGPADRRNSQ